MSAGENNAEVKNYIREKIRAGKFLIKSLHQRQTTIANIGREIVKRQREFMEKGVAHLKPMTMAQVAEVVGVHETTVSRAVSGKYIETPQGVFEMKYFFTAGLQNAHGDDVSNTSVKDMIADIFKGENPSDAAVRPGSREDAHRQRHHHRPPHRGQIPRRTGHPAVESAEGVLNFWLTESGRAWRHRPRAGESRPDPELPPGLGVTNLRPLGSVSSLKPQLDEPRTTRTMRK